MNKSKIEKRQAGTTADSSNKADVTTSSQTIGKPNVGGCGSLKPILFSTEMVKAILDGRKSQTRRILKVKGCKPFVPDNNFDLETILKWNTNYYPYGKAGDVLWVRETFGFDIETGKTIYKADEGGIANLNEGLFVEKWKPSLFMPYKYCRLFLKVTNIRVEKLNDITEMDAQKEGAISVFCQYVNDAWGQGYQSYFEGFKNIWLNINGEKSWNENPFVWVIEFERCVKP